MIEYGKDISKAARTAAQDAFNEICYPIAVGGDFPQMVIDGTRGAQSKLHTALFNDDAPAEALASAIYQVVLAAAFVENLRPEAAYRRSTSEICKKLADDVEILTEGGRKERYEDVSALIADDEYNIAIKVAASHLVSSAARLLRTIDEKSLVDFIAAELEEGNPYMLADALAIKAAARKCGSADTADNVTD